MNQSDKEMSFLEHLEMLRQHLIRSALVIVVTGVLLFICKDFVFDQIILAPSRASFPTNRLLCFLANRLDVAGLCINQTSLHIQNITMAGQFTTHVAVSFVLGTVVAFPYVFWEFWRFVRPALYPSERQHARGAVWSASLLFSLGILFAYYLILPLSIDFLGNYRVSDQVENIVSLNSYISTFNSILLSGGVVFELPVLMFFLAKIGFVTVNLLKKYRRHSIVLIFVFAAIITPPDVVSQIMVAIPLLVLYEISIGLVRRVEKGRLLHDN